MYSHGNTILIIVNECITFATNKVRWIVSNDRYAYKGSIYSLVNEIKETYITINSAIYHDPCILCRSIFTKY